MDNQLYCPDDARKALVRDNGTINGIDYLEVLDSQAPSGSPPQRTLLVHCFLPVGGLTGDNVRIEGGVRFADIGVVWAFPASAVPSNLVNSGEQAYLAALPLPDHILVVRTDSAGDFSTYTLRLVLSPTQPALPPEEFDALLSSVDFSFKIECPADFDCKTEPDCPPPSLPAPQINYLAKDYATFRQLLLDRLSVIMPDWQERNAADLGMTLVELLSYVGDYLSYYQDAVATEAYLGTARRRVSVKRHARLLEYNMHDGSNARTFVEIEVAPGDGADGATLPAGTILLDGAPGSNSTVHSSQLDDLLRSNPVVFETLHDLTLSSKRNGIAIYPWGDPNCCLPKGATCATLDGSAADLALKAGDLLIVEEVLGPASGNAAEADPSHRQAVRLDSDPVEQVDALTGKKVVNISWFSHDALAFPLCLREFPDGQGGVRGASVARGNVALADHGYRVSGESLVPGQVTDPPYRPVLQMDGLTFSMPYEDERARKQSASDTLKLDLTAVVPAITLEGDGDTWNPRPDLLGSDRFAPDFVVEMESDGRAFLRFGDDVLGRQPAAGAELLATYRIGSGAAGNVGAEAISRVVTDVSGITRARNPVPAAGGTDPEPIEQVKLYAPQAFRTQERAVTEADYGSVAGRFAPVQRAAATRRWTGSWYTMFVSVDPKGGTKVDAGFDAVRGFLEPFRMAGYDLEIDGPHYVPLDILLTVCVEPGYLRSSIKQALLQVFGNRTLPDGTLGFFHPDNWTFNQPVYLSQIVATAMQVPGVLWIDTEDAPPKLNRFQRWGQTSQGETAAGRISMNRLEIARADNDPSAPENGRIDFIMQGGL